MTAWGPNEHDTCRDYVHPAILQSGWPESSIKEQFPVQGDVVDKRTGQITSRRADYVLEKSPGLPMVVIEAKRAWAQPGDGIQQATRYATKLGVPFSLSTNGHGWVLYNAVTGQERPVDVLPSPEEAWDLFSDSHGLNKEAQILLLSGFSRELKNSDGSAKELRYYQRRAVHEVLTGMSRGDKRLLLVMATGTGKTMTAMQLVWKLWNYRAHQNTMAGSGRPYRVLYLADRRILVSDPINKYFKPVFGESVIRVNSKETKFSRDLYFATYQALDSALPDVDADATEQSALTTYAEDFFDLVIVDECHRGSARENSAWRQILNHFTGAVQLGLTATPVQKAAADTFDYFGNPVFEYSLREGIEGSPDVSVGSVISGMGV